MKGYFRLSDFLITVFFLLLASFSIILFRHDLLQTISTQNKEPAGIVIIKKNIVQRRLGDRVLWDRLSNEAPVYLGDLIRVADVSSALLDIENNSIDLDENTLIRITRSPDGEGFKIELSSGKISVSSGKAGKGILLELNGQTIKTNPGTVLSAAAGKKGMSVDVSNGTAHIIENKNIRVISSRESARDTPARVLASDIPWRKVSSGERFSMDLNGKEIKEKAAVVTEPVPNARYLKNARESVPVNFEWNRINFMPEEKLRLEIAMDSNFKKIFRVNSNLDRQSRVNLDTGLWYWRLSFESNVLSDGRITITDGSGPQLISPAVNSRFSYLKDRPELNFRWEQIEDASSYILEAGKSADFSSPQIHTQIAAVNYSSSSLGDGTWYWRVMPVFPSAYAGSASFSQTAFFRIEQSTPEQAAENAAIEKNNLDKWLASVTPSKENLPPDVPKELIPKEFVSKDIASSEPNNDKQEKKTERVMPELRLLLPAQKAKLDGLTALRKQTVFTWEFSGNVVRSRFVLSKDPNPLQGRAAVEIKNPGRTVRVDSLGEGVWYWNVEVRTADGSVVTARAARQIQVLPIPLLQPPKNITPRTKQRYGLEDLRPLKNIVFEWKTVKGANAYIFSLYQQMEKGRRQIIGETQSAKTSFVLNDLKVLENGTFIWQVEAVITGPKGVIEQRGRAGEFVFILDFPPPEPVKIEDTGILYGN